MICKNPRNSPRVIPAFAWTKDPTQDPSVKQQAYKLYYVRNDKVGKPTEYQRNDTCNLQNLGWSCYMSAAIQCVFSLTPLREIILGDTPLRPPPPPPSKKAAPPPKKTPPPLSPLKQIFKDNPEGERAFKALIWRQNKYLNRAHTELKNMIPDNYLTSPVFLKSNHKGDKNLPWYGWRTKLPKERQDAIIRWNSIGKARSLDMVGISNNTGRRK